MVCRLGIMDLALRNLLWTFCLHTWHAMVGPNIIKGGLSRMFLHVVMKGRSRGVVWWPLCSLLGSRPPDHGSEDIGPQSDRPGHVYTTPPGKPAFTPTTPGMGRREPLKRPGGCRTWSTQVQVLLGLERHHNTGFFKKKSVSDSLPLREYYQYSLRDGGPTELG